MIIIVEEGQSIREAMKKAKSGDTVKLMKGIFTEPFAVKDGVRFKGSGSAYTKLTK